MIAGPDNRFERDQVWRAAMRLSYHWPMLSELEVLKDDRPEVFIMANGPDGNPRDLPELIRTGGGRRREESTERRGEQ